MVSFKLHSSEVKCCNFTVNAKNMSALVLIVYCETFSYSDQLGYKLFHLVRKNCNEFPFFSSKHFLNVV